MAEERTDKKSTKVSIFETIDRHIFSYVDLFLSSSFYQQITDQLSSLGQNERKIVNHSLTFLFVLTPLFLTGVFAYLNFQSHQELEMKKSILSQIHSIRQDRSKLSSISPRVNSPILLEGQGKFNQILSSRMSNMGIEQKKVRVLEFTQKTQIASLAETMVTLNLQDFTMSEFTRLFSVLLNEYKFRADYIELQRNNQKETLEGKVDLLHFRRI